MNEEVNGPWNAFQCQWTCKWNWRLWLKWQHHFRAEIFSICTWYIHIYTKYIYLCPYVYGHAERPAMYFDGCLSSELSQLNCVTWKCLNIIKANLIIEARGTTTNKCMKEVWSYLRCSDGFWCCASHYKYVVGTTLGSECVIVWVTECSSSAWV